LEKTGQACSESKKVHDFSLQKLLESSRRNLRGVRKQSRLRNCRGVDSSDDQFQLSGGSPSWESWGIERANNNTWGGQGSPRKRNGRKPVSNDDFKTLKRDAISEGLKGRDYEP